MNNTIHKPLYQQLVDDILEQLSTGKLVKGSRLPPETDYALSLGVSRSTIRLAFSHLEKAGIIVRRKRGGTEIISVKPINRFELRMGGLNNVLALSRNTQFDLTDVRTVGSDDFFELQNYSNEPDRWLRCTGTRSMDGQAYPFVWAQVFVANRYADISVSAGDSPSSITGEIENLFGVPVHRVKQRYSASLCSAPIALALGLNESDPVVSLFAEMLNECGELIQIMRSLFDPNRFQVVTDVNVSCSM